MQEAGLFRSYTIQTLLDKLDVIECFENPVYDLRIGEVFKKIVKLCDICRNNIAIQLQKNSSSLINITGVFMSFTTIAATFPTYHIYCVQLRRRGYQFFSGKVKPFLHDKRSSFLLAAQFIHFFGKRLVVLYFFHKLFRAFC